MEKTEKPKRYKIETIEDILEIPAEAFDRFLGDLKAMHKGYNVIKKDHPAGEVKVAEPYWVDDNRKFASFIIRHKQ